MIHYLFENDYQKLMAEELSFLSHQSTVLNLACEHLLVPDFLLGKIDSQGFRGIEINENIVRMDSRIKLCDVDKDRFPFNNDTFDAVLSIWGMEHFQELNVFKESLRVLKPGGKFVFISPNLHNPAFLLNKVGGGKVGKFYYKNFLGGRYVPHQAYYKFNTRKSIIRAAKESGFEIVSITYFGPSNFLDYFTFSKTLQKLVTAWERLITNRFLYFLKPYSIAVFRKKL